MNLPTFNRIPGAIAVDLDGTLLNNRTQLSERNRMGYKRVRSTGHSRCYCHLSTQPDASPPGR